MKRKKKKKKKVKQKQPKQCNAMRRGARLHLFQQGQVSTSRLLVHPVNRAQLGKAGRIAEPELCSNLHQAHPLFTKRMNNLPNLGQFLQITKTIQNKQKPERGHDQRWKASEHASRQQRAPHTWHTCISLLSEEHMRT